MTDRGIRIDVYSPAGIKLDARPITSVLLCSFGQALNKIGSFSFDVPASDVQAESLTQGAEIQIYVGGEGLCFRGVVDEAVANVTADGVEILHVRGSSIARWLVWSNTLGGLAFNNVTLASAVSTLLSGERFSAGDLAVPSINIASQPFYYASKWQALGVVAEGFTYLLREDAITAQIDIGPFGQNPNGIRFQNLDAPIVDPEIVFPLVSVQERAVSAEVWNYVIPLGKSQGLQGSGPSMDLSLSTRTSPYTIQNAAGPDGKTYYYLKDTGSITDYGQRIKALNIPSAVPVSNSSADRIAAANTLYDRTVTWLQRHKDRQTVYVVQVVGLKTLEDGSPLLQVGDKVRVIYNGIITDSTGDKRRWKNIDASFYVLEYRRTLTADGHDAWDLAISDLARDPAEGESIVSDFVEQVTTLQTVPLPFILFGGGVARMTSTGLQIAAPTSEYFQATSGPREIAFTSDDWATKYGSFHVQRDTGAPLSEARILIRKIAGESASVRIGIYDEAVSAVDTELLITPNLVTNYLLKLEASSIARFGVQRIDDDNYKLMVRKGGALVEVGTMPMPAVFGSGSEVSLGVEIAARLLSDASATWPLTNKAFYVPFVVTESITVKRLWVHNGTVVSGNIDVGIYEEDGTKLVSSGSTAQAGISQRQVFDIADTVLAPGRYYFGAAMDNTTGTVWRFSTLTGSMMGVWEEDSAFPLPASATFAATTGGLYVYIPIVGAYLAASP